jgi:hypothetical protein
MRVSMPSLPRILSDSIKLSLPDAVAGSTKQQITVIGPGDNSNNFNSIFPITYHYEKIADTTIPITFRLPSGLYFTTR